MYDILLLYFNEISGLSSQITVRFLCSVITLYYIVIMICYCIIC